MEEWKAPWLTTESGFADIVIGIEAMKSGNVDEKDNSPVAIAAAVQLCNIWLIRLISCHLIR
jgi:hypothetical protein